MRKTLLILLIYLIATCIKAIAWTEPRRLTFNNSLTSPRVAVLNQKLCLVAEDIGAGDFYFLQSWNSGLSWSDPVFPADSFYNGSLSPDIAITYDGIIHVAWLGQYEGLFRAYIFHQSSSDGGVSWGNRHPVFSNPGIYAAFPRLISTEDRLFLICRTDDNNLTFFRSTDGGISWQDSAVIDVAENMDTPPNLLYSQGRLHAIYELNLPDERTGVKIFYSQSDDNGVTWSDRIYLSLPEVGPPYYDSQYTSAYADEEGHIVAAWFDFQYGSMCGGNGDIFARVSTDNGASWEPETRLTYTHSGYASSCLILNGIIYVVWEDSYPFGCNYYKLMLSNSSDWGESWSEPQSITPNEEAKERLPNLFWNITGRDTLIHCAYMLAPLIPGNDMIYYVRNIPFYSRSVPIPNDQEAILSLEVSQDAANSTALITYKNSKTSETEIEIYNILGQKIWSKQVFGKEGCVVWDASAYSSGPYFARVAGEKPATTKLILVQ